VTFVGGGINIGEAFGVNIPIDYTSRDYSSLLNDLQTLVSTFTPEWAANDELDFGVILLELFAYVGDINNYYIDRIANECFLTTAQQASSVINIAALIDYSPTDAASATAVMTLTLNPNQASANLPIYSQFSTVATATQPAIIFETLQEYVMPITGPNGLVTTTDASGNTITVSQGTAIVNEPLGTSNGTASQQYTLANTGVVGGSVQVSVNQGAGFVNWLAIASLIDAGPFDQVYDISTDANDIVYVNFGDGNNGAIPNPQSPIEATYIVGGGSAGNVGAGLIVTDLTGTSLFTSVTNAIAASGGADAETIAQIQANAPASLTAANRCVTVQDYATVALQLPGVSKANALATLPTSVTLYVHPAGGPYVQADLIQIVAGLATSLTNSQLSGYLDTRKMAGTTVTVLPPTYDTVVGYMPIILTMTVYVQPQYSSLVVQQAVQTAMANLWSIGSVSFGQLLTRSSVYAAINKVAGVSYLIITAMSRGDGSGLGDIQCNPSEIPVIVNPDTGSNGLTINMSGGL
jgi:Baseplate J-like protein